MNKPPKYNELNYLKRRHEIGFGDCEFNGIPCPTTEAHDLIGDEGVTIIQKKLQQMLEWRKRMFYPEYKFSGYEEFFDTRNNIVLAVEEILKKDFDKIKNGKKPYSELIIPKEYEENNYTKLINTNKNHYHIYTLGEESVDINRLDIPSD